MPGSTIVEMNAHDFLADCENEPTVWAQESKALDRNLRRVAVLVTYRHPLQLILGCKWQQTDHRPMKQS
jgi:metal-dependent hydrolase (beta-lactamase superfamily II)